MRTKKNIAGLAALLAVGLFSAIAMAGVPADKAEITIDHIKGPKGAVVFPHAKHPAEFKQADGKPIVCKTCHHKLKVDTPKDPKSVKGCPACHVPEGQAQKEIDGKKAPFFAVKKDNGKIDTKSVIFHKRCRACHKKVAKADPEKKGLPKCKNCHKK